MTTNLRSLSRSEGPLRPWLRRPTAVAVSAAVLFLGAAACGDKPITPPSARGSEGVPVVDLDIRLAASLETFSGCEELLGYYRDRTIEAQSTGGFAVAAPVGSGVVALDGDASRTAAESSGAAAGGDIAGGIAAPAAGLTMDQAHSTTNVQEASVDEPDIVKTDGDRIVVVNAEKLTVVRAGGGAPEILGSVKLPEPGDHQVFLTGDRVLVLTRSWGGEVMPVDGRAAGSMAADMVYPGAARTTVSAVDLAGDAPQVVGHQAFEGELVSARLHESRARVVLRSTPILPMPMVQTQQEYEASFKTAVQDAELEDFLPGMGEGDEPVVDCADVSKPPEPSGNGTVTVLTFDADGAVEPVDSVAVVADAQTVYASTDTLYVATNEWVSPEPIEDDSEPAPWKSAPDSVPLERYTTAIHAFDVSGGDDTEYLGSGRVVGQLLNQWSLSEHEGFLRVATTEGSPWMETGEGRSESFMTVLERQGDKLVKKGAVGGLGPGETIQSVRFIGATAYVVTFRQTDPLYVLDLADPAAPKVLGELKVTGFSSYLHPVAEDRLLGIGQAANEQGVTEGFQVSLFDVADPAHPGLVDRETIRNGYSSAQDDHRAFLWWGDEGVAVVPASAWSEQGSQFGGAVVYEVSAGAVDERGRITHAGHMQQQQPGVAAPDYVEAAPEVMRSVVVGDTLYTVSYLGVMASDLGSLGEKGWAPLPQ